MNLDFQADFNKALVNSLKRRKVMVDAQNFHLF